MRTDSIKTTLLGLIVINELWRIESGAGFTRAIHGPRPAGSAKALCQTAILPFGRTLYRVLSISFRVDTKKPPKGGFLVSGGEEGIRTLDTLLTYTHFPGVLLQPLGHLSVKCRVC
jgi:hypothetical protein